jgi:hypothetical protein
MTIKISDLSVGDWVEYEGLHYPITFVGYGEGGDGSLVNLIRPDLSCFTCKISDIHPIPITAEILEKNGFVKKNYDNDKMWDWWCDNVLVRKYADEDIYRFIVALNSMHYTTTMVVGKHTHQLQHALRLAGIDKDINL